MAPSDILATFDPVFLDEMENAKLMNRIDTKYLAPAHRLEELLKLSLNDYRVLEIDGKRMMEYSTSYFDTPDSEMFYDHQRGKKSRQKIRIRRYEDSGGLAFLEVKDKNNKGRTVKTRKKMGKETGIRDYAAFIDENSNFDVSCLANNIDNRFHRITLVRRDMSERVTIDTDVCFHNQQTGKDASVSQLVIIEWKRKALSEYSPMRAILKKLGIRESGFSKYCVGIILTNPEIRHNRHKPRIRTINKLSKQLQDG